MDAEQTHEVLDADSVAPQQQETEMEKVVVSKLTEPEKSLVTVEDTLQLAANGHDAEQLLTDGKETDKLSAKVTELVKPSEKTQDVKTEDNLPKEMSEQETLPDMPPEKEEESEETETLLDVVKQQPEMDRPPEKRSDPVTAPNAEPENTQLDQPMPANTPEPLLLPEPQAANAPEPEPKKFVQAVPEVAEQSRQALPGPVTLLQPEEQEQLSRVEEVSAQAEAEVETVMDTLPEEVVKEVLAEKDVAAEPMKELEQVKPVKAEPPKVEMARPEEVGAAEAAKEVVLAKPAESETVNEMSAETENDPEPEKPVEAEAVKGAETSAAEGEVEEEKVPAPGSLSFALLEQEQTKVVLRTSRTLIILRGLPGSGKSLLARAIADGYQDLCSVFCADDHGIKPENPEASSNGYKALDEAVVAFCSAGPTASVVVVVDDTNHTQDRLARLGEIAEQHRLVAMFLEPRTEWNRDSSQLAKRTGRGLEEAQIQAMKGPYEEMSLPLYFGWFLVPNIQDKVRCTSMDFLKTLDTLEAFKKHSIDFTGVAEKEVDLEQYFQPKGILHCTTKFCDYGNAEGAKEYAEKPAVKELYGSAFELSLSALFVTPRTVGAKVSLSDDQMGLWPDDAEKEVESAVPSAASLPLGSRAHITLGCAEGVEPVQTGLDLLEILALQQEGQQGELVEEMELGTLAYYGKGRWLLSLRQPISVQACFSSMYEPKKADQVKKEAEKKKKLKCTIL